YACFVRAGHNAPRNWRAQLGKLEYPVVSISWYDATSYAAWLAELTGQPWRLATEAEWEKAARWDDERRLARPYPWGYQFDPACCNTSESGFKTTTPIGAFPSGASPCGAQELAGNIWEWTSSLFRAYPYSARYGSERAEAPGCRVLRGGSWALDRTS